MNVSKISQIDPSQNTSLSFTQDASNRCRRCERLELKYNREVAFKVRAARDAATAREHLEKIATGNQKMLQTALTDLTASRKEVDRLMKLNEKLAWENSRAKEVLQEMKISLKKHPF